MSEANCVCLGEHSLLENMGIYQSADNGIGISRTGEEGREGSRYDREVDERGAADIAKDKSDLMNRARSNSVRRCIVCEGLDENLEDTLFAVFELGDVL